MSHLRFKPRFIPPQPYFRRAGFASRTPPRPLPPLRQPLRRQPLRHSLQKQSQDAPPVHNPRENLPPAEAVSDALRDTNAADNTLLAPVHIPEDPNAILTENHPATHILANSAIVVQRKLELMNVLVGFEQANKYMILDPQGNHLGYIAERDLGMGNMMARQMFSTHRSFTAHVFDKYGTEVLRFHRPFSWISSKIGVYDPLEVGSKSRASSRSLTSTKSDIASPETGQADTHVSPLALSEMRVIGEAQQQWAPLRRKYNLFVFRESSDIKGQSSVPRLPSGELPISTSREIQVHQNSPEGSSGRFDQFAYVDEAFLSWDFSLLSADSRLIGSVNRNFSGFGREIFTDTGVYALRMDAAGLAAEPSHLIAKTGDTKEIARDASGAGMTLDQRAVMLATAVSVDFDYFSRKSGGVGFMPLWFPWGGAAGESAGGVAGAEAAGGAVAGAGAAAATAAAQSGANNAGAMGAGPTASSPSQPSAGPPPTGAGEQEEVWGESSPEDGQGWNVNDDDDTHDGGDGDGGAGSGGDGGDGWSDFF